MKLEKGTEIAMLLLAAKPKIEEVKKLLKVQKIEEAKKIVDKDVWGLLYPYIELEREKFDNAPDSLKIAPIPKNMEYIAEQLENALKQFYNMDNGEFLPVEEWNPDAAQMYIEKVINS